MSTMPAPATVQEVDLLVLHGTAQEFDAFSDISIGAGAESEPNNRLGAYFTTCPLEAVDYADQAARDFPDLGRATVLAVRFTGRLGPAFFAPLDNFVSGDLADALDGHAIAEAFAEAARAAEEAEDELDPCAVFATLREQLRQQYDALWIESGEMPMLCVLNPATLRITHRLTADAASEMGSLLEERGQPASSIFGCEDCAIEEALEVVDGYVRGETARAPEMRAARYATP